VSLSFHNIKKLLYLIISDYALEIKRSGFSVYEHDEWANYMYASHNIGVPYVSEAHYENNNGDNRHCCSQLKCFTFGIYPVHIMLLSKMFIF
ncbi:hypothetical protein, partial [Leuconostoc mesenteroides]|uniref:hypothetical protein n=2 Tax=Leuconostoc mesenteroides TaxID=1245 RepID=UPI001E3BD12C